MAGVSDDYKRLFFHNHLQDELPTAFCRSTSQPGSKYRGTECRQVSEELCNGSSSENTTSHCIKSDLDTTEISDDSRSSSDACSSSAADEEDDENEDDITPEVQQAYRIFHSFLTEKHKALTAPFWHPINAGEKGGNEMSFKMMDNKFVNREYESITEFVADFRLMLENCYRFHSVDHWISKQAQKLEIILEQKLILLSRPLREKTTLAVTSRGRFGTEDEKGPTGTSTRRRSVPRNLAAITVGGCESIMVQALRLEEQQRAKEEKRQRELEKKEAEEASAKEVEEWESSLLSLAEPWPISTMWELPAIGHFLCLAQTALNLPEIVFFELERCLLMPRCSSFLAKVMSSLLCQPNRRATLHRRPALPYRRWEAELRQKVLGWYQEVGRAEDQVAHAEQLGLCHQFFWTLGVMSPLEKMAFHLLPFNQRVWLLKGLCDNVYETQKDVQDAVLGQPIHECRESILGYDSEENAYIHFPHFCGADLRIYCQSPCTPLNFPLPPFHVKKLQREVGVEGSNNVSAVIQGRYLKVKEENSDSSIRELDPWMCDSDSLQDTDDSSEESESDQKSPKKFLFLHKEELHSPVGIKGGPLKVEPRVKLKELDDISDSEPCLKVGEICYKGKSPAISPSTDTLKSSSQFFVDTAQNDMPFQGRGPCPKCPMSSDAKQESCSCICFKAEADRTRSMYLQQAVHSGDEVGRTHTKRKTRKKKKEKSIEVKAGTGKLGLEKVRLARVAKCTLPETAAISITTTNMKKKDKRKQQNIVGGKLDSRTAGQKIKEPPQLPVEPKFKLVCTSLDELRNLISKTEDELDELESTKKRCAGWYVKRESVKELHITLIRLLNELLPWEQKLLKAFQRNRARLKKENDDFKKHPEYENFTREESTGPEGNRGACKKVSSSEISRELTEDDIKSERALRRESEATECENHPRIDSSGHLINEPEVLTALTEFRPLTRSSKRRQSSGLDDDLSPSKRGKLVGDDSVFPEPQSEVTSRDQTTTRANLQVTERDKEITVPLGTFQRNCKPIQALLAKSVGNKVTLMNHPQATSMAHARPLPNRTAAVAPTEPTTTGQLAPQPALVTTRTQTPVTSSATSNSVKVVYNTSEGLSVVQKDGTPFKFSVQPVMDQKTGEKIMQQVIILPSNLLIQRTEETKTQLPSNIQQTVPTSKAAVVLSNSPVSTVPENKIPVQQVAPLKDTSLANKPSPAVSPSLQKLQITSCRTSPAPKKTTEPPSLPNLSPTLSSPSTNSNKCDAKQELKTVCIRDSQSILVTTRGGNTGVVKVQTSEQSGASSLPTSPVFTMLPQFQPFYVSKSSAIGASTAQAPHTTTAATLLPINSSLNNQGNSSKSLPQSPIKYVNQSPLLDRTSSAVTLSKDSAVSLASLSGSLTKTGQTLNSVNSLFPASSQSNSGVLSTARAVQGVPQTTASKGLVQSPLKRFQASSIVPEQSTFQKVFLVAPKTEISAATTSMPTGAPVPSAVPGSRVLFMSQSVSGCSTVTIPKGSVMSGSSSTATTASIAVDAMKPGPNLAQTTGSTPTGTLTKVQGINISGLTARIVDKGTDTNKNLAQQNDTTTTVIPVTMSSVLATSSSGLVFVQKNSSAANSCAPLNVKAPVKLTGSADGKTVTFSTYGNGHMASSALLTAVDQKLQLPSTASISSILQNNKITTESVVTSSNTNLASPSLGSIFNKDTTLPRGLMADKTWASPTVAMVPSPIKPSIITTVARVPNPLTLSTTATPIPGTPPSAPQQGLTPVVRSPVPGSSSVQEKVVINTNAPLAPGTQLFINNMRFVVPAQGLGPGSHVLFFSSPAVCPALPVGTSPVPPVLREAGALNHLPLTHVVQGPRMVAPGMQSNCMPVNLPAKVGTSVPIQQHSTAVRVPLVSTNSTVLAQVTSVGAAISSGQQSLTNVVRLPSFLSSGGKEQCVTLSHNIPTSPKEIVAVSSQLPKSLQSMATPALLQTGLLSTPHQPQLTPVASPAKGVISRASPMIAMPPMSSTVSRMQTLPVATVPPIGSTISCSQATPTATVPPSVNTLIMARCQPVRGVQPGSIRMPVVIPNPSQVQGKAPVQLPGVHPIHPPSKLLLSPDGAILNVVGCPTLQNLPVMANSMTAQTVVTTCSSVTGPVLNTLDSQRILSVNPKGPNY
ncbi:uncharacterized protein KIAA2026 isoform X1 [Astyanax mexicanus]|uniref:uncharacterized protein KIAA2026 isoform X1 n=1 Tax=Astyanax mexicanus TaxID=7994 RepID=UPI0020CB64C7|nr:uncharacterized protein KIAA2026 isoform X1 [Astyanax mexicanus]XP_015463046.3 uncharacterized protein KIAA2026 isoform X1 [Astyanax mexicanus]